MKSSKVAEIRDHGQTRRQRWGIALTLSQIERWVKSVNGTQSPLHVSFKALVTIEAAIMFKARSYNRC